MARKCVDYVAGSIKVCVRVGLLNITVGFDGGLLIYQLVILGIKESSLVVGMSALINGLC